MAYRKGDRVTWTVRGHTNTGDVVHVVPKGENVVGYSFYRDRCAWATLEKRHNASRNGNGDGNARDHDFYIVLVKGRPRKSGKGSCKGKLYCPRVAGLTLVKGGDA